MWNTWKGQQRPGIHQEHLCVNQSPWHLLLFYFYYCLEMYTSLKFVDNKTKGKISKYVLQEKISKQVFRFLENLAFCFLVTTILSFALLPYYRRNMVSLWLQPELIYFYFHICFNTELKQLPKIQFRLQRLLPLLDLLSPIKPEKNQYNERVVFPWNQYQFNSTKTAKSNNKITGIFLPAFQCAPRLLFFQVVLGNP